MKCWTYYKYEEKKFFIRNKPISYVSVQLHNILIIFVLTIKIIIHSPSFDQIFSIEAIMTHCLNINYNLKRDFKILEEDTFIFKFKGVMWTHSMCFIITIKQNYTLPSRS